MPTNIEELLKIANAVARGEIPEYQQNESFTSGAFDLLLVDANRSDAFDLLTELCRRYEAVIASGSEMHGYFHLLGLLARQTNTTEMPPGLQEIITAHPDLSRDLREWYREAESAQKAVGQVSTCRESAGDRVSRRWLQRLDNPDLRRCTQSDVVERTSRTIKFAAKLQRLRPR